MLLLSGFRFTIPALMAAVEGSKLSHPASACHALASAISIENATVNFAELVTAGTNLTLSEGYNLETCVAKSQVLPVDVCRVSLHVRTSNSSGITLEGWLPTNYTRRFLMTGNGGLAGCIDYPNLAYGASLGFAAFGQNGGHNGTSGAPFYHNPEVVKDFVYRGIATGTAVGKQVSNMYYGRKFARAYYVSCSTGGRQGWKMVQDFPDVFDGVVVGAPAFDLPALTSWSAHFYPILGNVTAPTFVTSPQWTAIHEEIMNQCDSLDGVFDGVIEDTSLCNFRPEALQCEPGITNSSTCLTSVQVGAVRDVFSDYYGVDGDLVFPRMEPGSELIAQLVYYTGLPFVTSTDWFRYVVLQDPNWDPATFNRQDAKTAIDQDPFGVSTFQGDLSAFRDKGGKVLHWHGGADFIITSENSPRYYNLVSQTMGLPSSDLDEFYRLFMVPGTGHCGTGPGAHAIGQASDVEFAGTDPQHNIISRIIAWVEEGHAPETITGTKYFNDDPAQGIELQRNHCKYPKRNMYIGPQNYTDPESWVCV